jgi:hypothetical protein
MRILESKEFEIAFPRLKEPEVAQLITAGDAEGLRKLIRESNDALLEEMSYDALRRKASGCGLPYSTLNKAELINALKQHERTRSSLGPDED